MGRGGFRGGDGWEGRGRGDASGCGAVRFWGEGDGGAAAALRNRYCGNARRCSRYHFSIMHTANPTSIMSKDKFSHQFHISSSFKSLTSYS